MYRTILFNLVLFFVSATVTFAQTSTISGVITEAETNEPIPQVNVFIVELERGDATDLDGAFEISGVEYGTYTIRASSVGYTTYEESITVDSEETNINITLDPDLQVLDDVVVTAFGLTREERSLGYSIQEVSGEQVARIDQGNLVGALAGKVSGVQVVGSTGANLGGSERIRIRGVNGLSEGQPLFVVDGTPVDNTSFSLTPEGTSEALGRDLGNLASDLNLQNVESISVLKGAAAAALYGNRASNGVIVVTTKRGEMGADQPIQVDFSNNTYFERVYILPDYQNEYAGGYTQDFIEYTDPVDGQDYLGLNYAADESWGPRMDGTMYRPWWSWFEHDFTGDGQSDYGTEIPLTPQPDNVRNFFDTGVRFSNNLSIAGGAENASYRVGLNNTAQSGVIPNSSLDRTAISFNGALSHSDKFTSRIAFNYVNTQADGRPAQGYSAVQGNAVQSFNQWFQRQLNMDYLRDYRTSDGTLASWNIQSPTNLTPLYWDSPFFSVNENISNDDRDRIYGNFNLSYNLNPNIELIGKLHLDTYGFTAEDRIATGGLEEDWYYVAQRSRREVNYEIGARYEESFQNFSLDGYIGGNIRTEDYSSLIQETAGGLSTPNFFNIDASIDRPNVSNFNEEKQVRSVFGTATIGFRDLIYLDGSLRNDWSSSLPEDNNSYLYYGLSASVVFTEFDVFANQQTLSFGKLRASIAQVGNDLNPYQVFQTLQSGTPFGGTPAQTVPNTLNNPDLRPAISSDYEVGLDLRFLDGRLRTDVNYYQSVREDEILELSVPGASGYDQTIVNAGNFTTTGWEFQVGGTPIQSTNLNVDMDLNFATSYSEVNELAEGITSELLENAFFGVALYAREGQEWGTVVTTGGYGGFLLDDQGRRIVNPDGTYALESNKELGSILPDWTGGFNLGINYRNFNLGTFFEFQKGGQFYSITKMFGTYSGLGSNTVGSNTLGNPVRNPVLDSGGNQVSTVSLSDADPASGGALVEGVDEDGNEVAYLRAAELHFFEQFYNKERWLFDASYVKLREVKLTYNIPADILENLPVQRASVALDMQNALLIYSSTSGVDPSAIQNNAAGFGFWEGGGLPGTRSIGFNINLGF
ncbi:MAG: SusC/RagA family TonB-linked outer membrane protein [Balneolaceae bacterium]